LEWRPKTLEPKNGCCGAGQTTKIDGLPYGMPRHCVSRLKRICAAPASLLAADRERRSLCGLRRGIGGMQGELMQSAREPGGRPLPKYIESAGQNGESCPAIQVTWQESNWPPEPE
jgi:hypothetical protein